MEAIRIVEAGELKKDRGGFAPGDTVKISVKVIEGEKERLQAFEGVVIRKRGRVLGRPSPCGASPTRGRRAHVPPALAAHRQDPGDEAGHRSAREALLPARAGRQEGAPQGEAVRPGSRVGRSHREPERDVQQRLGRGIERPLPLRASCVATRPHARGRRGRGGAGSSGRTGGGGGGRAAAGHPDQGGGRFEAARARERETFDAIGRGPRVGGRAFYRHVDSS